MQFLIYAMIYMGSALMAVNIFRYVRFARHIQAQGSWEREQKLFQLPILLLVLFLMGYLAVGLLGKPDLVIAGILFGGSVFVFVMLLLIRRAVDRIQQNERLEAQLLAAEEANKAKTFFLSNMSHDIRTPLNAIIGYTTLARREEATPGQKDEYLGKIDTAGRQLLDLVNDVLEMSRIESGKLTLEPETADLETVVEEVADLVRTQLEGRQIRFAVSCDIAHRWVLCDRPLLNRALMNLLCNAGKFTEAGGNVSLSLYECESDAAQATYRFQVRDTGIGMDPEFVEKLFTPFEREKTSTVSRIQGTGLGMSITKAIVDLMGGTIEVETEKGRGTAFTVTVTFPLAQAQAPSEKPRGAVSEGLAGLRVLLVEDNAVNMEIAKLILTQADMQVDTAENGQIALEKVATSRPGQYQAVLMDIQMPVMDGYAATRAIRALPDPALSAIPVIAMTANAFQEDVRTAEEAGMDGHIAKPIDIAVMMQTLTEVLSQSRGQMP